MGYSNFKLNGTPIKNPKTFDIEYYTITKSTRVANGNMVMDFVANKRKFNFGYDAINSLDMNRIIYLLWESLETTRECFSTLTYIDDGVEKEAVIYTGSIVKKLHRASSSITWVWKDVTFSLIER